MYLSIDCSPSRSVDRSIELYLRVEFTRRKAFDIAYTRKVISGGESDSQGEPIAYSLVILESVLPADWPVGLCSCYFMLRLIRQPRLYIMRAHFL